VADLFTVKVPRGVGICFVTVSYLSQRATSLQGRSPFSGNVGGVKCFWGELLHSFREERHFALVEGLPFQPTSHL